MRRSTKTIGEVADMIAAFRVAEAITPLGVSSPMPVDVTVYPEPILLRYQTAKVADVMRGATPFANDRPTKPFLATYRYNGGTWHLTIFAFDFADAEARCKVLNLTLDGEAD